MAYKQKGFPMHSTRSVLKQTTEKPNDVDVIRGKLKELKKDPNYNLDEEEVLLNQLRELRKSGQSGTGDKTLTNNPNVSGLYTP
mgnify:FL=1